MGGFIEPNIHPVIVHFGYALIVTALVAHLLGRWRGADQSGENLKTAGDWMLALGTVAIVATVASGLWAYYTVAHDSPAHAAMTLHRNWALPTAGAVLALGIWRYTQRVVQPGAAYLGVATLVVLALSATAWLGGNVVYGHGVGVQRLVEVSGDGHDHGHGDVAMPTEAEHHAEPDPVDQPRTHDADDEPVAPVQPGSPGAAADLFSQALSSGDRSQVEALFSADAIIAEGGGTERSFAEYASHHLGADMAYVGATSTKTLKRDVVQTDDMAVVITESLISGSFRGQDVRNRMVETLTLRDREDGWKIVHVHWSSAPAPEESPDDHAHDDGDHEHVAKTEGND